MTCLTKNLSAFLNSRENLFLTMATGCFLGKYSISQLKKDSPCHSFDKIIALCENQMEVSHHRLMLSSAYQDSCVLSNKEVSLYTKRSSCIALVVKVCSVLFSIYGYLGRCKKGSSMDRLNEGLKVSACIMDIADVSKSESRYDTVYKVLVLTKRLLQITVDYRSERLVKKYARGIHGTLLVGMAFTKFMSHFYQKNQETSKKLTGVEYIFNELPLARPLFYLTKGVLSCAEDNGIQSLLMRELDPVAKDVKEIEDGFSLIGMFREIHKISSDQTPLKVVFSTTGLGLAGNFFDTLKWLGKRGGISDLSPYSQMFGYVKKTCSTYLAVEKLFVNLKKGRNIKRKEFVSIVGGFSAFWFNAVLGLRAIIGEDFFIQNRMKWVVKPPTSYTIGIVSGIISIGDRVLFK